MVQVYSESQAKCWKIKIVKCQSGQKKYGHVFFSEFGGIPYGDWKIGAYFGKAIS